MIIGKKGHYDFVNCGTVLHVNMNKLGKYCLQINSVGKISTMIFNENNEYLRCGLMSRKGVQG